MDHSDNHKQMDKQTIKFNDEETTQSVKIHNKQIEKPKNQQEIQDSSSTTTSTTHNAANKLVKKTFRKRPGTTDLGKDYEHFYLVHLCLKLIQDGNLENFFLSSNDIDYGDFDDVIIEISHKGKVDSYAVQLKHKEHEKKNEKKPLIWLMAKKNFSLQKYFESYDKYLKNMSPPVKMILFTNVKLREVPNTIPLIFETETFELNVTKEKQIELITTSSEKNNCYNFNNENVSADFKNYLKNFYLYSDQLNVTQLEKGNSQLFQNLLKSDESAFKNFVGFITKWSMIEGHKSKLDNRILQRVITLCVLTTYIKPLTISDEGETSQNEATFRDAVSKFRLTRLNEENYDFIKNLWSNVLRELVDLDNVNKIRATYQLGVDKITSKEELKGENIEICKLLWILGKCPLVVKGCSQVYQVIKLFHGEKKKEEKFIILDSERKFNEGVSQIQHNISVFNSLENLKEEVYIYEDILNNFTYSIEGQKEETLKTLLKINETFVNKITTDKVVRMLNKPLLIGKQKEVLPPNFIERTLTRILIGHEFLKNYCSDSVVIVSCVKNLDDVKKKLEDVDIIEIGANDKVNWDHLGTKKNNKLIYITKNIITEYLFLSSKYSAKTVHHLRYFNDSYLEWIASNRKDPFPDASKGYDGFQELVRFRLENESNEEGIRETELFSDTCNKITIICANPGMGKTTLMRSLKNNSSSRFWTILIYARGHASFFRKKNNNPEDFMKYIYEEVSKENNEDLEVFQAFWKEKHMQIIWDGLDEASNETFETILGIISNISKQGIKQWLTARINLRNRLEQKFQVFSRNLNKFSEDEQKRYVKDRLNIISDTDGLNKIFKTIDNINLMSVSNNSIMEIPLQIYMLTQLLVQDRDNYLNLLNTTFTIVDLYEHFVEEKFKVYYVNKLKRDLSFEDNEKDYIQKKKTKIEFYKTIAYNLHFSKPLKNTLDVDVDVVMKNILKEIKQSGDRTGFIISVNKYDDNFEFVHNSFGEYFAALYLFDKEKYIARYSRFIFDSRYNNIRFFLDLMLCAKLKAFVAVLYKNSSLLRQCTEDDLRIKDDIGRDVLELSCAWSKKYPLIEIDEFTFYKINRLGRHKTDALQYEHIFKKFDEIENILPLSLKKILLCLPFLILFYREIPEKLFNFNVLYYTIKFDLDIIFDCFQDSKTLVNAYYNIDNKDYLSIVFACNSKRIMEKIMTETKYQNVLSESLSVLLEQNHSNDLNFISSLFQLPNINSLLNLIPIHYACQRGWLEVIRKLKNLNVKLDVPDSKGLRPVHYACQNEREYAPEIVQLLINSKINLDVPDSKGLRPIHYACQNQGEDASKIVSLLINSGAKLDVPDSNGLMPVHYVCQDESWYALQIAQLLISSKIKLDVPDSNGLMPIHYACKNKGWYAFKFVQMLINSKIQLDVSDSNGLMPIHYACRNKGWHAFKIVQLLIHSKVRLDVPDLNGLQPIHYACQNRGENAPKIVQLLINSKVKQDVTDSNGLMPIQYARENEKYVALK